MKSLVVACTGLTLLVGSALASAEEIEALEREVFKLAAGKAKITAQEAIKTAGKESTGAVLVEVELGLKGAMPIFEIEFLSDQGEQEVEVDAVSGKVIGREVERPSADEAQEYAATLKALAESKFTLAQAIEAALRETKGGTVVEAEAEVEDGELAFEVEVLIGDSFKEVEFTADGKLEEVEDEKAHGQAWIFDADAAGEAPMGWKFGYTNPEDGKATWTVAADGGAPTAPNVLKLATQSGDRVFNIAMAEGTSYQDVDIRTRIRADRGKVDQGGGVIWRCRDASNYYICRINPLEGNFRVYKVVGGKRMQLETARLDTESGRWYEVRAVMVGDSLECFVDGKKYLEARDGTFTDAGMVGLWTKADALSSFDDVVASSPGSDVHDDEQSIHWEAAPVEHPPTIDGIQDDRWSKAKPVEVVVRKAIGGADPRTVTLRAVYTKVTLYVLAQWKDATPSEMRDPYVWNASENAYERPAKPDDQFALEFPISGQFDRNMLSTEREFEADVWHWKAGRTNPSGWADDKRHIIRHSSFDGAKEYRLGGRATVFIARPNDSGTVPYKTRPAPTSHSGDVVDSFETQKPTGSCADVRAKGVHDGSSWTLEMARKLDTRQPDDAVLRLDTANPCAIAVLDDELYWRHSVSEVIHLRFVQR